MTREKNPKNKKCPVNENAGSEALGSESNSECQIGSVRE